MQTLQQMTDRTIALTNQVARELNLLDHHGNDGGPVMDRAPLRAALFGTMLELVTFTEEETDDNAKVNQPEG